MSSIKGRFSFSNDDGDELQSSLLRLFNGQETGNGKSVGGSRAEHEKPSHGPGNSIEDKDSYQIKGPNDASCKWLTSSPIPDGIKVLLVFPEPDAQLESARSAVERLGWSSHAARDDDALELFQAHGHELVVLDQRKRGSHLTRAALDDLSRSLSGASHRTTVLVGLVSEDSSDGDVPGLDRVLIEGCVEALTRELRAICEHELAPRLRLAATLALHHAVDGVRDMVHIVDSHHVVQFANEVSEKLLGLRPEELVNRSLSELVSYENFALVNQQLQKGREFHGNVSCRRSDSGKTLTVSCRIVPYCAHGRRPSHYIYLYDTMYLLENTDVGSGSNSVNSHLHPRGSSHSLRSFDVGSVGSDLHRRCSIAKIHNLPLEAPITKVIALLTSAMTEAVSPEVALQIEKAIEILKTTELYAPCVRDTDELLNDPITSDLIGALISAPSYSRDSRRSSNDSSGRVVSNVQRILHQQPRLSVPSKQRAPREIEALLESWMDWDFDVFKLERISSKRPLYYLGMHVMASFDVASRLGCDERVLQNWLTVVEVNYTAQNSYHNSSHAADVLQAIGRFMRCDRLKLLLDPLDEVAALIAAVAHDIDHPGKSSAFLCNNGSKLAILYNDLSVLESHHAALTFRLTLSNDEVNIFKNLEKETYKLIRQNVIDMILATEMTKHFEHLAKFVNVCSVKSEEVQSESRSDSLDSSVLLLSEKVSLVKRMMIKCADVSNPTRPLRFCIEWTKRIAEEYFRQTDEEIKRKLPVVMPMFERSTCSIPKSQIGFIDYIINDMMEAWDAFIDLPEMITYMKQNYETWKDYNDRGISTMQDIEKLQQSPELQLNPTL